MSRIRAKNINNYIRIFSQGCSEYPTPLGRGFFLTRDEIDAVTALVAEHGRIDRQYRIELKDANGVLCGEVTCTVHVRLKPEQ